MSDPRIDARLSDEELDAIEKRMARAAQGTAHTEDIRWLVREDVPALVAEVRSLRAGALRESVSPARPPINTTGIHKYGPRMGTAREPEGGPSDTGPTLSTEGAGGLHSSARVALADAVGVSPPPDETRIEAAARAWAFLSEGVDEWDSPIHDEYREAWRAKACFVAELLGAGVSPPSPSDEEIEAAARALYERQNTGDDRKPWDELAAMSHQAARYWAERAEIALEAAARARVSVPPKLRAASVPLVTPQETK